MLFNLKINLHVIANDYQQLFHHYYQSFGGWPYYFWDYWNKGLMGRIDNPETDALWELVDPYSNDHSLAHMKDWHTYTCLTSVTFFFRWFCLIMNILKVVSRLHKVQYTISVNMRRSRFTGVSIVISVFVSSNKEVFLKKLYPHSNTTWVR